MTSGSPSLPLPQVPKPTGFLKLYLGPMFSGKTTHLLKDITRYADSTSKFTTVKPLLINSKIDTRDEKISTHSSQFTKVATTLNFVKVNTLAEVDVSEYHVIGIDEANFYPDLFKTVVAWVVAGKQVFCSGLNGTAKRTPFGQVNDLIPHADKIVFLTAICDYCMKEAITKGTILLPETLSSMKAAFTLKIAGDTTAQIEVDPVTNICQCVGNIMKSYVEAP